MASAALIIWPFIGISIFAAIGPVRGLIWTTMVGYLFLPEAFNFNIPGLPPYDKTAAISLSLVLGVFLSRTQLAAEQRPKGDRTAKVFMGICIAVLVVAPLFTIQTNGDTLFNGPRMRPSLSLRDAISVWSEQIILFTPMFLAARYLWRPEHMKDLLVCIVVLGLLYTLLALFEMRMSPQLHRWTYGYFQHTWRQHLRGDGFRPIVFLSHGLTVGFFLFSVAVSAFSLAKGRSSQRTLFLAAGAWSFFVLLISNNLGASILAIIFCSLVLFGPTKVQLIAYISAALLLLSYPALKHFNVVPTPSVVELAESISPKRARSFGFRLENEDALLDRAFKRPVFGWGAWARAWIIDDRGRNQTIVDGAWIIQFGEYGWFGYLGFFGLLCAPLVLLWKRAREGALPPAVLGMAAISAGTLVNLIPNSNLSPMGLMLFGCLWAFILYGATAPAPAPTAPRRSSDGARYTRFDAPPVSERATEATIRRDALDIPYRRNQ